MTHHDAIQLFAKTLGNLAQWMEKATAYAQAKGFEVDVLAQARLAPDQYPFARQVQSACDQAKYAAAYLGGKQPPSHPDTEQTFAELHQRIEKCLNFLDSVRAPDFAGSEDRKVSPPWLGGKWMRGDDYLVHVAVPNFFFHATTAYAILRHNGVDLGKMDFVGSLPVQGFFKDFDTTPQVYDRIRKTYDGPLSLAEDFMVWNVTKDKMEVRLAVTDEHTWSPPTTRPNVPPGKDDRATFAKMKGLPPEAIGYSDFIADGKWNVDDVLRPIYQEASEAVGREFPYPEK